MRQLDARWTAAVTDAAELLLQNETLIAQRERLQHERTELLAALMKQARTFVDTASALEP